MKLTEEEREEVEDFKQYWRSIETVRDLSVAIANTPHAPEPIREQFKELQRHWDAWEEIMWADDE